ncbi:MAG: cupin domain-containing protein [Thermohalobaculum sp.]|nr:cupin domain-containing protein [Thermohalobaculum sp.]
MAEPPAAALAAAHDWGAEAARTLHPRCRLRHLVLRPGMARPGEAHLHRAERWVVIAGCACVCIGAARRELHEGGSVVVPVGVWHALSNPGRIDLHLLMIETGPYLGDDDRLAPGAAAVAQDSREITQACILPSGRRDQGARDACAIGIGTVGSAGHPGGGG